MLVWPDGYAHITRHIKIAAAAMLAGVLGIVSSTNIIMTFGDLDGNLVDAEQFAVRDAKNRVAGLLLPDEAIWISNHQIYTDWAYMWFIAARAQSAAAMHIVLKKSLRKIPGIGFSMEMFNFIFLSRNWEHDKEVMERTMADISSNKDGKTILLLYPEGTNRSRTQQERSNAFADKAGLPRLDHVLLPRVTGLYCCTKVFAERFNKVYLVDYTVAYEGVAQDEYAPEKYTIRGQLLKGLSPPRVHIHCDIVPLSQNLPTLTSARTDMPPLQHDLPNSPDDDAGKKAFGEWLYARWAKKSRLLDTYYHTGSFGDARASMGAVELCRPKTQHLDIPFCPASLGEELWNFALLPLGPLLLHLYCKLIFAIISVIFG
ncbi:hypothetical protein MVES1_001978 [Malassezia vespertilionis]|uniref:uncharacterized protein n=1 Tax=Malassezia vespertilionis TaxID=2020962 RepID=UPI0024B08DFD|nr:uncharacterized protein MVES1_001978 [Malassezia vespertilionis]WFD06624.1 hypothetical protein MVES1_001978 [Malassezia vespertilionis]